MPTPEPKPKTTIPYITRQNALITGMGILALIIAFLIQNLASQGTNPDLVGSVKAPLTGLVSRYEPPTTDYLGIVHGWVVTVPWSDLQISQGGTISSGNAIDSAIAQAQAINKRNGVNLGIEIEVRAGFDAPEWAKELGGSPITLTDLTTNSHGTVGRWWSPAYQAAFGDLQQKLAALYDKSREVRGILIDETAAFSTDPFDRGIGFPVNGVVLYKAGYTEALDRQALEKQVSLYSPWKFTPTMMYISPYSYFSASDSSQLDVKYPGQVATFARNNLGPPVVLLSADIPAFGNDDQPVIHQQLTSLGKPMAFVLNSAKLSTLGVIQDLQTAYADGASQVELPTANPGSFYATYTVQSLAKYDAELQGSP